MATPTLVSPQVAGDPPSPISYTATAGDSLYLWFAIFDSSSAVLTDAPTSVSDNKNGAWTKLHDSGDKNDGANHHWYVQLWELKNSQGGTLSISFSPIPAELYAAGIFSIRGADPTTPIDVSNFGTDAQTTDGSGNTATPAISAPGTKAGDLVVALMAGVAAQSGSGLTAADPTNWTLDLSQAPNFPSLAVMHRNAASSAGETPSGTFGGFFAGATGLAGAILAFQGTASSQTISPAADTVSFGSPAPSWQLGAAVIAPAAGPVAFASPAPSWALGAASLQPAADAVTFQSQPFAWIGGATSLPVKGPTGARGVGPSRAVSSLTSPSNQAVPQ